MSPFWLQPKVNGNFFEVVRHPVPYEGSSSFFPIPLVSPPFADFSAAVDGSFLELVKLPSKLSPCCILVFPG